MRIFESPISSAHLNQEMKFKNHQSPITKLTNLTDVRTSCQPASGKDNVLNDRSNEVFVPRNAAKYVEKPFERRANREKEIEQIRKKYNENSHQKTNRPVSQKYDRYEIYRENESKSNKRDEYGRQMNQSIKRSVLLPNHQNGPSIAHHHVKATSNNNSYIDQNNSVLNINKPYSDPKYTQSINQKSNSRGREIGQQSNRLNSGSNLERISQASNSNYDTVTKTLDTLSPERNRVKSSFVADDRSSKRKLNDSTSCYFIQNFRNKENQGSVIKETTSVYNESATRVSHINGYYERGSTKSGKLQPKESRVQPNYLKPFSIQEPSQRPAHQNITPKPPSRQPYSNRIQNSYPTIYDTLLHRNSPATIHKQAQRDDQTMGRNRTYTQEKRHGIDRIKETNNVQKVPDYNVKRRVIQFEDEDKIKEIQQRLKNRQAQFRKRQEHLKYKCDSQYQRKPEHHQNASKTYQRNTQASHKNNQSFQPAKFYQQDSTSRPNVQKEIQRLSLKIKQFQDRKKQLNLPQKAQENVIPIKNMQSQSQGQYTDRKFQDARKALQKYRHDGTVKSTSQVYQVAEYQIPSSVNNEQSNCKVNYQEELGFHKKYMRNIQNQDHNDNRTCDFLQKTKPMYSQRTLPTPKRVEASSSSFAFQLFKIENEIDESQSHTSKITVSSTSSKTNAKQCRNQFQIHRRTDDGIQQRKKRLQQNSKAGPSQEMKKLVLLLSKQTIHDQELRNCKIWFQNERNQNKWKQLKAELKKCEQEMDQYTELKDGSIAEFCICEDENNPFFSVNQQSKFTLQSLVKSFVAAKSFWFENIVKKFNKNSLKAEGFNLEKFDLEKKGFINMEDLVRFLNFESGNFYRNRDLVLIFKRLLNGGNVKSQKSLTIDRIFDVITY